MFVILAFPLMYLGDVLGIDFRIMLTVGLASIVGLALYVVYKLQN